MSVAAGGHRGPRTEIRRVFLSSTFLDLEERRRQVIEAIEGFKDLKCVAMERFTATAQPALATCLAEARDADLFLGILAYRYGWIPEGETKSITELEHDAAHGAGIDRLMFVVDERKRPMIPELDADPGPERWTQQGRLAAFKQRLSATGITPRPFGNDTDLITRVLTAIAQWRELQRLPPVDAPVQGERELEREREQQAEMRYRDALLAEHRYLRFVGFTSKQRAPMSLEELFVPLLASARSAGRPGTESDPESESPPDARGGKGVAQPEEGIQLAQCLALAQAAGRRGAVIEGRPGAGKTTHLRRLCFGLLNQGPGILGLADGQGAQSWLPVFIPLRSIRKEDFERGLAAVIARALPEHCGLDETFTRRLIERDHLVLLFDGLDEAPPERRESFAAWLEGQLESCARSVFILTTRPAGYSKATRAALAELALDFEIQPLSDEQIRDFVNRWYRLHETTSSELDHAAAVARGAKAAQELLDRLAQPAMRAGRILEMTANPLLLTIICLVHRDGGSYLPDDAARLYAEASQVLLESWRRAKGLEVELSADRAGSVLRPLARFLHEQPGRTSASAAEIAKEIAGPLKEIRWTRTPEDFLCAIRDESGLLVGLGDDRFAFLHLGFQEYFTALEIHARIAEHALDDDRAQVEQRLGELAKHLGESWWQEVILLLLKRAERPHLFVPLFRWIADHAPELFGSQSEMVDACIRDSAILRSEPFAHALSRFRAKPEEGSAMQAALYACVQVLKRIEPGYFESRDSITQTLRKLGDKTLNELLPPERGTPSIVTRSSRAGIELVRIAGGRFRMGGNRYAHEQPIHEVEVPEFWLARTPVTNAQYQDFVRATGRAAPPAWKDPRFNAPDQPVVTVSWDDAQAFCGWAGLRLPSEAEWEYACRAGSTGEYCFGDDEERLAQYAWFGANSEGKNRPVGQKLANAFGLHDMHGNVWEWCEDSWHETYAGAPVDASAWVERGSSIRGLRGGSWSVPAGGCRSAYRLRGHAGLRSAGFGFRPASSSLD